MPACSHADRPRASACDCRTSKRRWPPARGRPGSRFIRRTSSRTPTRGSCCVEHSRRSSASLHTVGLSVGSAAGVDRAHLQRLRRASGRSLDPILVSGHLAWSTHGAEYLNDLLPLPYNEETLASRRRPARRGAGRARAGPMSSRTRRAMWASPGRRMTEVEFLAELVERTGCQLLCDVSNVYLSAAQHGLRRARLHRRFPAHAVAELHLGGFTREEDDATPGG